MQRECTIQEHMCFNMVRQANQKIAQVNKQSLYQYVSVGTLLAQLLQFTMRLSICQT